MKIKKCKHTKYEKRTDLNGMINYKCLDCGMNTIKGDTDMKAYFHFVNKHTSKIKLLKKLKREVKILWRKCVLAKFGSKCIVCNATKLPNCHHLISERSFPVMRYDIDNGVVLCPFHHKFNKFSAHKNSLWFCELILKTVVSSESINSLINKMLSGASDNFIWTIDLYYNKIKELTDLLLEIKKEK